MSIDAPQPEVWWEGRAYKPHPWDAEGPLVQEFRGESAEADARAWFEQTQQSAPGFDAAYVYRVEGAEHRLVLSWADTYPWDGTDEDDDGEWWASTEFDDDGDGELDWAAGECSMMADGQCGQAGSEHCDFECPFRDAEIVEVDSDETKGQ